MNIRSWDDWDALPTTPRSIYQRSTGLSEVVTRYEDIFTIGAPLDRMTSLPGAFRSYRDLVSMEKRVLEALRMARAEPVGDVAIAVKREHMYAAADLVEILASCGIQCHVVLSSHPGDNRTLNALEPDVVVSLNYERLVDLRDFPTSCRVLTVNQGRSLGPRHVDIAHLDIAPCFAACANGVGYQLLGSDYFVETDTDGEVLLTSVSGSLIPLFRYRSGLRASIKGDQLEFIGTY